MPPKRRVQPLPIEFVALHPRVIGLPVAGFGMLMRLVIHYWMTDCRPLPTNADRLSNIAHAHRPTWALHRDEILSIFAEVVAELDAGKAEYEQRRASFARIQQRGVSALRRRTLEKTINAAQSIASIDQPLQLEGAARHRRRPPDPAPPPDKGKGFIDRV